MNAGAWVNRVRHDLVKRLAWPARDLQALGRDARADDLPELRRAMHGLVDEDGQPIAAAALWRGLRAEAPAELSPRGLDALESAITHAATLAEAAAPDPRALVAALLAIDGAWSALARDLRNP